MVRQLFYFISMALLALALVSCSNDETEEQKAPQVAFATQPDAEGLVEAKVKFYDGHKLSYTQALYMPSGEKAGNDFNVTVATDGALLEAMNTRLFGNKASLYYQLLDASRYVFDGNIKFKANEGTAKMNITFNLDGLDLSKSWVLPLKIVGAGTATANTSSAAQGTHIVR